MFRTLIILLYIPNQEAACPMGFLKLRSGTCLTRVSETTSYCSAHEICHNQFKTENHRLFLVGGNAKSATSLTRTTCFWTSVNMLLDKGSLRYGDPGRGKSIVKMIPLIDENGPVDAKNHSGVTVACPNITLSKDPTDRPLDVICELSSRGFPGRINDDGIRSESFRRDWPVKLSDYFHENDSHLGCFKNRTFVSLYDCLEWCVEELACRSFYYNEESQDCYLALYVDSLLPKRLQEIQGHWVRYARPNW